MPGPLSFKANIQIEEARGLIDDAIEEHLASILALKSQRSSFAPITCLPPEILSRIFFFAQKHLRVVDPDCPRHLHAVNILKERKLSDWIAVTHVSRYWRNVALNSPNLWVAPPVGNLRWVEEMLERSKDAGLVIEADFGLGSSTDLGLNLALKCAPRIKNLSLLDLDSDRWNYLQGQLSKFVPRLESLCLEGLSIIDELLDVDALELVITISEDVLCETGRLYHLELTNCKLSWSSQNHLFHSLTHLKLHNLSFDCRPTGKQFMDALKEMPNLVFLDLHNALPLINDPGQASWALGQHNYLASLQDLFITSAYGEVEAFFRCVTFPPTATVRVICDDHDIPDIPITDTYFSNIGILKGLAKSYSNALVTTAFQTLILKSPLSINHLRQGVHLRLFTEALSDEDMSLHTMFAATLELTFTYEEFEVECFEDAVSKCMKEIFKDVIPLVRAVKHVHFVEDILGLNARTIASTIGMLPQVNCVVATNEAARLRLRLFLDALQTGTLQTAAGSGKFIPVTMQTLSFPKLTAIYLCDADFEESDSVDLLGEQLRDCLVRRYDYNMNIEHLMLEDCRHITEDDIEFLENMVDSFTMF